MILHSNFLFLSYVLMKHRRQLAMDEIRLLSNQEPSSRTDHAPAHIELHPDFGTDFELRSLSINDVSTLHTSAPISASSSLYEAHETSPGQDEDPGPSNDTPSSRTHQDRDSSRTSALIQHDWFWEILSMVGAVLALAAIVSTLLLHVHRPLPKWPLTITINSLIAVFSAILKACLVLPISECISQLKWLWLQKPRPLQNIEQWDLASRGQCVFKPFMDASNFEYLTRYIPRPMGLVPPHIHTQGPRRCRLGCHSHGGGHVCRPFRAADRPVPRMSSHK